jgi:hypothetical protein
MHAHPKLPPIYCINGPEDAKRTVALAATCGLPTTPTQKPKLNVPESVVFEPDAEFPQPGCYRLDITSEDELEGGVYHYAIDMISCQEP